MVNRLITLCQIKPLRLFTGGILKRHLSSEVAKEQLDTTNKYLLILDFEATCDDTRRMDQEIIEFPCLKVNLKNFKEEARFHFFVKPVLNPELTKFCVELTGIFQEVVDEAKEFPEVFSLFEKWREEQGLTENNSSYVTSGDWDLGHMMPRQCCQCNMPVPLHMREWTDIKKLFGCYNEVFYNSFKEIMDYYGLECKEKAHSGIGDCLNMLQAVKKMGESNIKFIPTSVLVESPDGFKVKSLFERNKLIQFNIQCIMPDDIKRGNGTPPWNFSWVVKGQLAAMGWPQSKANLVFLASEGIKHLITLSPEMVPPIDEFPGMNWTKIPVEEFEAPTLEQIKQFIQICEKCSLKNEAVGIHCRQGRGRTGVMAACFLVRFQGLTAERAIINLRIQRPGSVETAEQERIVGKYQDHLRKSG